MPFEFVRRILGRESVSARTRRHRPDDLQLYVKTLCPFCMRVQQRMAALDVAIPLRNIFLNPAHRAELVSGGGVQMVPCLRIAAADGSVEWLYESADIVRYLEARYAGA
jgi:glutathione S-transferase